MASQHPDHAATPYWCRDPFIPTHKETEECYLAFSELGINEYKWDWEGKLVDESVMERMLSQYFDYFKKFPLGVEKFLTFRLPNPKVESEFRIGRALMGLLTAASLTNQVGFQLPPIFELILPMTETATEMIDIQEAFHEIASLQHKLYRLEKINLKHIKIIPLFEQVDIIMNSDQILKEYIKLHQWKFDRVPLYLRPYVARSDPALNSGLVPTVLAIKIALSHYRELENKIGIKMYPIIGSASLPFRGGLTPLNVDKFIDEYRGVRTALIQSAFRYDYPKKKVIEAIKILEEKLPRGQAILITKGDERELRKIIKIFEKYYRETIEELAPLINKIASYLPKRRERVQHVGLFGYSRGVGKVKLPRAIGFTAALYSLGVPPEIIGTGRGLKKISSQGMSELVEKTYLHLKEDLLTAGAYVNKKVINELAKRSPVWKEILKDIEDIENYLGQELGPRTKDEKQHEVLTTKIYQSLQKNNHPQKLIEKAAIIRKSLG